MLDTVLKKTVSRHKKARFTESFLAVRSVKQAPQQRGDLVMLGVKYTT